MGYTYNLTGPDLNYFLIIVLFTDDEFVEHLQEISHKPVGYDSKYENKKSYRYYIIKLLENNKRNLKRSFGL